MRLVVVVVVFAVVEEVVVEAVLVGTEEEVLIPGASEVEASLERFCTGGPQ